MTVEEMRLAIVFPADPSDLARAHSRLAAVAEAFAAAGSIVVSAPYSDEIAADIEARLIGVGAAALVRSH